MPQDKQRLPKPIGFFAARIAKVVPTKTEYLTAIRLHLIHKNNPQGVVYFSSKLTIDKLLAQMTTLGLSTKPCKDLIEFAEVCEQLQFTRTYLVWRREHRTIVNQGISTTYEDVRIL